MNELEPELYKINAHNKVQNVITTTSFACLKKQPSPATAAVEHEQVVTVIVTLSENMATKFDDIIKAIDSVASGLKQIK